MLKILIRSRFDSLWASLSRSSKKKSSKPLKIVITVLFGLLALYFVGVFAAMFYGIGYAVKETDSGYAFFALASIIASAFCMFGSIFTTKTQIFDSKDNDLLLSMPIKPKDIFLSRVFILLIVNYILESMVLIPAMITYGITIGYTLIGFVFALLVFLLLPLLTLALSALIAWIISAISSKIKNKTLVSVILFLAFFIAYFYFIGNISSFTGEIESIDFSGLKKTLIFWWIGDSIFSGNILHFLYFLLCTIVPSALTFFVLNKSFIKIITTHKGTAKRKYIAKREKDESVLTSVIKKEFGRFFSSAPYILNAGIGTVMFIVIAVALVIAKGNFTDLEEYIGDYQRLIPLVILVISMWMSSMVFITAPSISLENNNLWILQSSPVPPVKIFWGKILAHIILTTPCTVCGVLVLSIGYGVSVATVLPILITSLSMNVFMAFWGLFLGLKFPKFDWASETIAVKQGFAVFGAMFGGFIWAFILSVIAFVLSVFVNIYFGLALPLLLNAGVCFGLSFWFKGNAQAEFIQLKQ